MDFDDLEDAIAERIEAGEDVAGLNVIENNQPPLGTLLPLVERGHKAICSMANLPERGKQKVPPWNGKPLVDRKPVLRLLAIHGAGDSYEQGWQVLEAQAPEDIEVIMYEFPGHGHREKEPFMKTTQELADEMFEAFRDIMDTGAFAFLGHSIGALIAILVGKRARAELGVEPVFCIMLERGSAEISLFNDEGCRMLREEPVSFFKQWNNQIWLLQQNAGAKGQRTMDMWQVDQLMDAEKIDLGFHEFKCPMLAMQASASVDSWLVMKDLPTEMVERIREHQKWTPFRERNGPFVLMGHFPAWTYDTWHKWTKNPQGCKVIKVPETDHMSIKESAIMQKHTYEALHEVLKSYGLTPATIN